MIAVGEGARQQFRRFARADQIAGKRRFGNHAHKGGLCERRGHPSVTCILPEPGLDSPMMLMCRPSQRDQPAVVE